MNEQDLNKLFPIADDVMQSIFPTLEKEQPDYYEGIIAILVKDLLTADLAAMTDAEIKAQMAANLDTFRKILA
ncbi:hypothetical protein [Kurthia sibirica]|uniref:Uncharacterized protein n=1 Tax=Kurthia sibirica TaxID=202750 RepID=A0A2U3AL62_9BACL|nr:hypothetical protein [Kurthia sibirica]PWI25264.1 hypothetical protein DEX24_09075 [Kurthia sibirica]GEK33768.1 hypothetical protein KSI01_13010 [Kurthia sibirica]